MSGNGLIGYRSNPVTILTGFDTPNLKEWSFTSSGNLQLPAGGKVVNSSGQNILELIPIASATTVGGIKVGTNLTIDSNGVLNAEDGNYTLPIATNTVLGGVKIDGTTITIANGVISATKQTSIHGELIGSVFLNDSTLVIDGTTGNINGHHITAAAFKGTFVGDDSTVIIDGITNTIPGYISVTQLKDIVAQSMDFSDFQTKVAAL